MDRGVAAAPRQYKPGTLQPDYGLSPADARALTAYLPASAADRARRTPGGAREETPPMTHDSTRLGSASSSLALAARLPPRGRGLRPPIRCWTRSAPRSETAGLTYAEGQGKHLFERYCATCHGDGGRATGRTRRT